ncbi:methyl-accepting chemotaxis protein [Liquorilactobacillus satsumensis]|uniref:methyl-accepting chemotaxis protein n=1 Tax=Liquorilactobacillus satsumensis TaxID=259059 RepID=UPI0021C433CC|nr:methyl-accepting chemotaxis protein [Liquorilactobacillus satsumensis]MCP9312933.1 methyl-accepting chemotaxis protein [Liquorilactobacillus satsumensis]MCP9360033.1 methyl-accepting chemotaxis protein [Liquorilactobacillus satsumensis]
MWVKLEKLKNSCWQRFRRKKHKLNFFSKVRFKISGKSIGTYVALLIIAVAFISILGMLLSSYLNTTNILISRNNASKKSAVEVINTEQQSIHDTAQKALVGMLQQPEFKEEFKLDAIYALIRAAENENGVIKNAIFTTADGKYVTNNDKLDVHYAPTKQTWYQEAVKKEGVLSWSSPYKDPTSQQYVTSVSEAVRDATGKLGVLSFNISYNDIQANLDQMQIGRTGTATLISKKGIVLAATDHKLVGKNISSMAVFKAIAHNKANAGNVLPKGGSRVETIYYTKGNGAQMWTLAQVQRDELTPEIMSLISESLIAALVVLLIGIGIATAVTRLLKITAAIFVHFLAEAGNGHLVKIEEHKVPRKKRVGKLTAHLIKSDAAGNELQQVIFHYNKMIMTIGALILGIQKEGANVSQRTAALVALSQQTNAATEEVTKTITAVAQTTSEQAKKTQRSGEQIQQLSQVVNALEGKMATMKHQSALTTHVNQENVNVMTRVDQNWEQQIASLETQMHDINKMDASIQDINKIIGVINRITAKTNLLALNASIEAASAGDAGRGFAVVATEIRKLAEQSKASTKEIATNVESIQARSKQVVAGTAKALAGGEVQTDLIGQAITSSNKVVTTIEQLLAGIAATATLTQKIIDIQKQVSANLADISAATEENAAGTQEVSTNAEEVLATMQEFTKHVAELQKIAAKLKQNLVEGFVV